MPSDAKSLAIVPGIKAYYRENLDGTLTLYDVASVVDRSIQLWSERGERIESHFLSTEDIRQAVIFELKSNR